MLLSGLGGFAHLFCESDNRWIRLVTQKLLFLEEILFHDDRSSILHKNLLLAKTCILIHLYSLSGFV